MSKYESIRCEYTRECGERLDFDVAEGADFFLWVPLLHAPVQTPIQEEEWLLSPLFLLGRSVKKGGKGRAYEVLVFVFRSNGELKALVFHVLNPASCTHPSSNGSGRRPCPILWVADNGFAIPSTRTTSRDKPISIAHIPVPAPTSDTLRVIADGCKMQPMVETYTIMFEAKYMGRRMLLYFS